MDATELQNEFLYFTHIQLEVAQSLAKRDRKTARLALQEIESIWLHSEWERLRRYAAEFMRRHQRHCRYFVFEP